MKIDNSKLTFVIDDTAYKDWDPSKPLPKLTPEQEKRKKELFKELDKKYFGA
jgi:hypothetical protein